MVDVVSHLAQLMLLLLHVHHDNIFTHFAYKTHIHTPADSKEVPVKEIINTNTNSNSSNNNKNDGDINDKDGSDADADADADLNAKGSDSAASKSGKADADEDTKRLNSAERLEGLKDVKPSACGGDPKDPYDRVNIACLTGLVQPTIKGESELTKMGLKVPALAFDFDDSAEGKAKRFQDMIAFYMEQGLPEAHARLRAQLFERELVDKKARAIHSRSRAIIRLRQEARLRADAKERNARASLLEEKQKAVQEQLERSKKERLKHEEEKEERQKQMEEDAAAAKKKADELKEFKEQQRLALLQRQAEEAEQRRKELKQDKAEEREMNEKRIAEEKESKRKMIEDFQAMRQQQLEESKRLAREERIKEMEGAAQARAEQEVALGLKSADAEEKKEKA